MLDEKKELSCLLTLVVYWFFQPAIALQGLVQQMTIAIAQMVNVNASLVFLGEHVKNVDLVFTYFHIVKVVSLIVIYLFV